MADILGIGGMAAIESHSAADWREHKLSAFARIDGKITAYPQQQGWLVQV